MIAFGLLMPDFGSGGSGGVLLTVTSAETSQDGSNILITFNGVFTPSTYNPIVKVDGVDKAHLAATAIDNIAKITMLDTLHSGQVITVSMPETGNVVGFDLYPVVNKSIMNTPMLQDNDIELALTDATGSEVMFRFFNNVTGTPMLSEFQVVGSLSGEFTLDNLLITDIDVSMLVTPQIENGETLIGDFVNSGDSNLMSFADMPISNEVPVVINNPASTPEIDLDSDGLPNEVIYDVNSILITEDENSYQADLDGDGIEDIHIDKG